MKKKTNLTSVISCLAIVLVWYLASLVINADIILPDPFTAVEATVRLFFSSGFLANVSVTVLRSLVSFIIITVSGIFFGFLAGHNNKVSYALAPLITVFKATPVMSIILIAFLWFESGSVPVFSAFLMAFPVMFVQVVTGYKAINLKLAQMCSVYGIDGAERIKYLTLPSLVPYIITGAKQTLSMIWKVIIAAEVITVPKYGVGRSLQFAQVQLETADVFAWTLVAILLTAIGDSIFAFALKSFKRRIHTDET